jgi:hypothetical protein
VLDEAGLMGWMQLELGFERARVHQDIRDDWLTAYDAESAPLETFFQQHQPASYWIGYLSH